MVNESRGFAIRPVIHYPSEVQAGKTYLMTIDLLPEESFEWRSEEEEYPIYCQVYSEVFKADPVDEPVIVLHRFGGSYGEAQFLITSTLDAEQGTIRVLLINAWGVPIKALKLSPIRIGTFTGTPSPVTTLELSRETHGSPFSEARKIADNQIRAEVIPSISVSRALIITTLPVEYMAVRQHLANLQEEMHPQGTIYEFGKFAIGTRTLDVGIVEIGFSNAEITVAADRAIADFKPDVLFFVGIAGGIKDVKVGDVVTATKVYGYEPGKVDDSILAARAVGQAPYTALQRARAEARKSEWVKRIRGDESNSPQVFVAPIVAGKKVIASRKSELFEFWQTRYDDAIAFEIEGSGFLHALSTYSTIHTLVIRGISDIIGNNNDDADMTSEEDRQIKAAQNASAFAFEVLSKLERQPSFFAYDNGWVGRQKLVQDLSDRIRGNCRLLMLLGITGIGKTALGERLSVEVIDWLDNDWSHYHQENFDDDQQSSNFIYVAARWLEKWGELVTSDDRKDPEQLMNRTISYLRKHRYLVQMDSLENILQGDEEEGWSDFKDEWWLKFFTSYLKAGSCQSCFVLTSQDMPGQLEEAGKRSQNFWHSQPLSGLDKPEQLNLFEKIELDISDGSESKDRLEQIGQAYEGHPLALRVIGGEIKNTPFNGNVVAYWNHHGNEVQEVLDAIEEAKAGVAEGIEDKWKLDRFTKTLRRNVQSRFKKTFERLKNDAKWSYILLCEASVYRREVPEDFWLSHLEDWNRNENEQIMALDVLRERYLVEQIITDNQIMLKQQNLVRSLSLQCLEKLDDDFRDTSSERIEEELTEGGQDILAKLGLKTLIDQPNVSRIQRSWYRAAINWLARYQPAPTASNLDKVRGYLEAFYHLCNLENWVAAEKILSYQSDDLGDEALLEQLGIWGYYQEQIEISNRILGSLDSENDFRLYSVSGNAHFFLGNYEAAVAKFQNSLSLSQEVNQDSWNGIALVNLGNAYNLLGKYEQSLTIYQKSLEIARSLEDKTLQVNILGGMGNIYRYFGEYSQATNFFQQQLSIARQLDNRQGEANALGNLGNVYYSLGEHQQATDFFQQQLSIARQLDNRQGEANALGNLGNVYYSLGDCQQARDFLMRQLKIVREIGNLQGEANGLGNLGNVDYSLGDYEQAIPFYRQQLEIARRIGNRQGEANGLGNLGNAYYSLGHYEQAFRFQQSQVKILQEIGDEQGEASAHNNIGLTLIESDDMGKALESFNVSLQISHELGNLEMKGKTAYNIAYVYLRLEDTERALQFHKRALEIAESSNIPSLQQACSQLKSEILKQSTSKANRPANIKVNLNTVNTSNINQNF